MKVDFFKASIARTGIKLLTAGVGLFVIFKGGQITDTILKKEDNQNAVRTLVDKQSYVNYEDSIAKLSKNAVFPFVTESQAWQHVLINIKEKAKYTTSHMRK